MAQQLCKSSKRGLPRLDGERIEAIGSMHAMLSTMFISSGANAISINQRSIKMMYSKHFSYL